MPDKLNPQKLLRKTGQNYQQRIHFLRIRCFLCFHIKSNEKFDPGAAP